MVLETLYGLNATKITMHERIAILTADYNRRMRNLSKMRRYAGIPIPSSLNAVSDEEPEELDLEDTHLIMAEQEALERKQRALALARRRALALARSLATRNSNSSHFRRADSLRSLSVTGRSRYWQRYYGYYGYPRPQRGWFWGRGRGGTRGHGVTWGRGVSRGRGVPRGRGSGRWQLMGWTQRWQQRPQRFRGSYTRGRGRGMSRGMRRGPLLSKQELDKQLDEYMCKSKAVLDKQLEEYMSSAGQLDVEVIE